MKRLAAALVGLALVSTSACSDPAQPPGSMDAAVGVDSAGSDGGTATRDAPGVGDTGGPDTGAPNTNDAALDVADAFLPSDGGPCAACDDGIACTHDSCDGVSCAHLAAHGDCPAGQYCDLVHGCSSGGICGSTTDCSRPDLCATVTCDTSTATCVYAVLDSDHDGHAPVVCGGDDCNDAQATIHGGASELCNGVDDDCDGTIDEDNASSTACGDASTCTPTHTCVCRLPALVCGGVPFGTTCRDPQVDPQACGGCGRSCPAGVACVGGACDCAAGTTACFSSCISGFCGTCLDLQSDAANCGACGNRCPTGVSCVAGVCDCASGTTACGTSCVDITQDAMNCGTCGNQCPSGVACTSGTCPCSGGITTCSGVCTSLTDSYCGACNQRCLGGTCSGAPAACTCPADSCTTTAAGGGRTVQCVDFQTSPVNCGGCGHRCATHQHCSSGVCQGCDAGYTECTAPSGATLCADLMGDDNSNCGACNRACTDPFFCHSGSCIHI